MQISRQQDGRHGMTPGSHPTLKLFAMFIVLMMVFCLASAAPASASPKGRKHAVRSAKRGGRSKARIASRRGGSRARYSRRGGHAYVRVRGRHGRMRWRRVVASSSVHGVGVHNFLSDSWAQPQESAGKTKSAAGVESSTATANSSSAGAESKPSIDPVQPASDDATRPRLAGAAQPEAVPLNPLVAAYADSLAAFGFSSENQGFIVSTLKGEVLAEHNADRLFNPASVTKIATSLTAISRLGPDFKFRTSLYTDGTLDPSTGVLHGSLYVIGSGDPAFFSENAMMIADKLNRNGIRELDGNLVVLGQFYFNFSANREASAKAFRAALTPETWTAQVRASYPRFLAIRAAEDHMGDAAGAGQAAPPPSGPPSLKISGKTITDPAVNTSKLAPLAVHTSLPLSRVLKALNDFSNNWMATVIGNLVGGPDAVERFLKMELGFKEDEVRFATSSGLGANAISPRGTVNMLRKLITYLEGKGMGLEDILPIAGVDAGTLEKRFTDAFRGSVVGKTGTLSSVSALAGVAYTRGKGPLLFVIYNHGGSAHRFRAAQDETIKKLITLYGGPAPVRYTTANGERVSQRLTEQAAASRGSSNPK
jgi:serine-type D-Ala-D-Ala carboxypeptidase/endopeptidase (penicillin-binding protein 4)